MTNYVIKAEYTTGDSFHTEETSDILSPVWTDIEKAKKALSWLTEHHRYYDEVENSPRWREHNFDTSDVVTKPWYKDGKSYGQNNWEWSCLVELDDGTLHTVSTSMYHGYFETLHSLEIVVEEPNECDWKVTF